jgi:hypothetical protein
MHCRRLVHVSAAVIFVSMMEAAAMRNLAERNADGH